MGRWRPPAPGASPYITPAGYQALQEELEAIWLRRRDVVKALAEAAAEGDRSENAEYIYRKKELGGLDRRIRYLQKRMPKLKVIREQPRADAAYFGAIVQVRESGGSSSAVDGDSAADMSDSDSDSDTREYRLVGPDEADASRGAISIDSPVARALLGKRVGDAVRIATAEQETTLSILAIRYV